jgi:hypothetical protein
VGKFLCVFRFSHGSLSCARARVAVSVADAHFTALVSARPSDLDQPVRQQLYLRALRTLPGVSVHLGHFLSHEVTMPVAVPPGQRQTHVKVIQDGGKRL